jgi:hypothetical protein
MSAMLQDMPAPNLAKQDLASVEGMALDQAR